MQPVNAAFPLKHIVSGILLCFLPLQISAQPNLPDAAVYSAEWLPVYPQVSVNGSVSDGLYEFISHNETLLVQNKTLTSLGIRIPPELLQQARSMKPQQPLPDGASNSDGLTASVAASLPDTETPTETTPAEPPHDAWYVLDSIAQLQMQYDAAGQTLALTAPLAWLDLPTTRIGGQSQRAYQVAESGFAGVLNYDYNVSRNHDGDVSQGMLAEARLTTPAGYLSHNQLWSRQSPQAGAASSNNVRLDTYWRTVWADKGLVLTAGDVLTSQLNGSGSSRLGGIRLERTYSVQPWRNTAPLFSYLGESTLPGTIDLYLDGVKQYSRDIAAGKYEITLPPGISGSGMAQVVATDVLGRTVVVDMPLYGGSGLLAKGLSEWSLEAGYLRRGYGLTSADYDNKPAGSGTWRYGITNALTVQLHAEGSRGYRQIGAASSMVLGSLGQLNLSHAHSRLQTQNGKQSSVSFSTQKGDWSFGTGWSRTDGRFAHLSATLDPAAYFAEAAEPVRTASLAVGWNNNLLGSFALSYLHSKKGQETPDKVGTLNWNRNFGSRTSIFLSAARNFSPGGQHSLYGGVSFNLDKGYFSTLSGQRDNGGDNSYRVSVSKSSDGLNSPSWNIGWQQNETQGRSRGRLNGFINYDTQYGDARGNVYNAQGHTDWSAGWKGGLVWMNGGLFATRAVNNSFAVVSTDGVAGVPVSLFNNKVGHTNRKGLLLVPNLSAYQENTLDIDITDLPQNMAAERARILAVPSERSGVNVNFRLNRMQAASMVLKSTDGQVIPAGAVIRRSDGLPAAVVGFDGQTFIENLAAGENRFSIALPDESECRFSANYQTGPHQADLPDLGEIICTK